MLRANFFPIRGLSLKAILCLSRNRARKKFRRISEMMFCDSHWSFRRKSSCVGHSAEHFVFLSTILERWIAASLTRDFSPGGLKEFCKNYESLCENTPPLQPAGSKCNFPPSPICPSPSPSLCPQRPQGTPVTEVLPLLFLGNEEGAADQDLIDKLHIRYVLNITPKCPNYFSQRPDMRYKRITIHDSNLEDIGQYFEEAIQFIGKWQQLPGLPTGSPLGLDSSARGELERVKRDAGEGGGEGRPVVARPSLSARSAFPKNRAESLGAGKVARSAKPHIELEFSSDFCLATLSKHAQRNWVRVFHLIFLPLRFLLVRDWGEDLQLPRMQFVFRNKIRIIPNWPFRSLTSLTLSLPRVIKFKFLL